MCRKPGEKEKELKGLTEGFCGCGGDKKTSWFSEYSPPRSYCQRIK